jgi:predicted O-methyltransferase YrrM
MDPNVIQTLARHRQAFARNPHDRDTVLALTRLLAQVGQGPVALKLLSGYLTAHAEDQQARALSRELGAPAPAAAATGPAPASFADVSSLVDTVEGYLDKAQEQYLFDKVRALPDGAVILEIGCYRGKSTAAMAFACLGTRKRIYSIDTFTGNDGVMGKAIDCFHLWQGNLQRLGLDAYATPLRGLSQAVAGDHARYPSPDFVFIDASHEYLDVLEDFRLVYPHVRDGGWIAFHDVEPAWPGPWRVWKEHALHLLADHEIVASLACGRKLPARRFWRAPGAGLGFSFADAFIDELVRQRTSPDLVTALRTSRAGLQQTPAERDALVAAEGRIADAPEAHFRSGLKEMIGVKDAQIDGLIQLWYGLTLIGDERWEAALDRLREVPRVSFALPEARIEPYLAYLAPRMPGETLPGVPADPDLPADASLFQPHVGPTDTVVALGSGQGQLLRALRCRAKVGVEADVTARKHAICKYGIDGVGALDDLPDACADVVLGGQLGRTPAPVAFLAALARKLRPGGRLLLTVGPEGPGDLYGWSTRTLGNLVRAAAFEVSSVTDVGAGRLLAVAAARHNRGAVAGV